MSANDGKSETNNILRIFRVYELQISNKDIYFVIIVSLVYCAVSAIFSLASIFYPDKYPQINPLTYGSLNIREVGGHFIWGLAAGLATLRIRYALLGGTFATVIDSDHLIGLLQLDGLPRMAHSILFAAISVIVLMAIFGRRDYILGTVAATSVLTHISYDIFNDQVGFPLFTPILNRMIIFPTMDWILFEIAAVVIVAIVCFYVRIKGLDEKKILS